MNKFFAKFAFTMLSLVFLFSFSPAQVFAQRQYTPLEPLPGIVSGTGCNTSNPFIPDPNNPGRTIPDPRCSTNISTYLPSIFILLIGLAGALAVIMIVIGGVQYLSTDAISGKSEGKQRITNALVGLLLAIAAYIILNTLNPQTLQFNLTIPGAGSITVPPTTPPPPPPPPTTTTCMAAVEQPPGSGNWVNTTVPCSCPTCIKVGPSGASPYNLLNVKNNNEVDASLASALLQAQNSLSRQNINFQITEAWKPTAHHRSTCHQNGTCVDINLVPQVSSYSPVSTNDARRVGEVFKALIAQGRRPEYEVTTTAQQAALRSALQAAGFSSGYIIKVIPQITAPHWSVY